MYRIAVLSDQIELGQKLAEQTKIICAEQGLFPKVKVHHDSEEFFNHVQEKNPTSVVLAIPGVAGLNAAEHLRSLCPECGLIWCSDLDFSLHAYKLRAEYFILMPITEKDLRKGLSVWMKRRKNMKI